jgi:YfiH family protein
MDQLRFIVPDWPDAPPNIGALATTRRGGYSVAPYDDGAGGGGLNLGLHVGDDAATVARNRALLPGRPVWLAQVHGTTVIDASSATIVAGANSAPGNSDNVAPGNSEGVAPENSDDVSPGASDGVASDASDDVPSGAADGVASGAAGGIASSASDDVAPEADASIASKPGPVCVIMTADCLPVLFADLDGKVVGAAHAGWRGLAAGVLGATVAAMRAAGAGEITAWFGPAIGPQAFEVGPEVLQAFLAVADGADAQAAVRAAFVPIEGRTGKYLADMPALARRMLAADGVTRVWGGQHCTVSEHDRFYSYRRDGVTGRQASLIWLK